MTKPVEGGSYVRDINTGSLTRRSDDPPTSAEPETPPPETPAPKSKGGK